MTKRQREDLAQYSAQPLAQSPDSTDQHGPAQINTEFWGFSGRSPNNKEDEPFLTWLYTVGNTSDTDVPLLFSTSYGEPETFELPSDYTDRVPGGVVQSFAAPARLPYICCFTPTAPRTSFTPPPKLAHRHCAVTRLLAR